MIFKEGPPGSPPRDSRPPWVTLVVRGPLAVGRTSETTHQGHATSKTSIFTWVSSPEPAHHETSIFTRFLSPRWTYSPIFTCFMSLRCHETSIFTCFLLPDGMRRQKHQYLLGFRPLRQRITKHQYLHAFCHLDGRTPPYGWFSFNFDHFRWGAHTSQ